MLRRYGHWIAAVVFLAALFSLDWAGPSVTPPPYSVDQETNYQTSAEAESVAAPESADDRVADYTFALAWLTAVLAAVAVFQIYFLTQADKTSRIAANAARDAADIASETAKKQLRAYVHVSGGQVYNLDKAGGRYIVVTVINYGQTPARRLRWWMGVHVREWPLTTRLPHRPDMPRGIEDLPPNRASVVHLKVGDLLELEERALRNGDFGVYAWGQITYSDVFGNEWFTNIRLVCEGDSLNHGALHATPVGNEAT